MRGFPVAPHPSAPPKKAGGPNEFGVISPFSGEVATKEPERLTDRPTGKPPEKGVWAKSRKQSKRAALSSGTPALI